MEVLVEPERRDEPAEGDVLDDDPRDQEVHVLVARRGDRAAEDVDEEQHEHDRLHREGEQQVGRARQAHQVALGDDQGVGDQSPHAACSSSSSALSAAWPVSARNTSSSVGPAQPEVVDADAHLVEPAHRLDDRPRALADGEPTVSPSALGASSDIGASARTARLDRGGVGEVDLEALAADAVLELVGRALGDHAAAVDHRDEVGEPVGLVEVLGGQQHRRALGHEPLDRRPHLQAAARVQAGRGLVEEEHRRAGDERRAEVEAPAHAARVGLDHAVGGLDEVEALEQLLPAALGLRAAHAVQAADHDQVLEAGEVLVDGGVLPGEADAPAQLGGVADDVEARDEHGAGIGLQAAS